MKKVLLLLLALALGFGLKAQCPLTTAVDFTATDCHGTEVHLFDILDGGQYVLIDFFYTTCGYCQESSPKLVESYAAFGCNMHDVFYMEISDRDSDAACSNWVSNYGIEYPTISGAAGGSGICNTYQIGAFPTVILIAPDHSIVINDLWPIGSAQTVIDALEAHGVSQYSCTTPNETIVDFTGTDLDGNTIHLYDILDAGQFVLINYFLAGDPYCQQIMPDMLQAYYEYGCNEHDVFFMEICPNGGDATCQAWAQEYGVEYPTISRTGGGNDIAQAIPVGFYPTIMLIRPDHSFAQRDIYPPTLEWLTIYMDQEGIEHHPCGPNASTDDNEVAALSLYPNPANESLTLKGTNLGTIKIYNALGQQMETIEATGAELNINTTQYENGLYFIKVNESTLRFVVTH